MTIKNRHMKLAHTLPFCVCILLVLWPLTSWAHVESGQAGGFVSGLSHPVSGLDHVLAMIAVGLWGAQLGKPALWLLPIAFPMMMAFGGMLGLMGIPVPGIEIGIAVSGIVLGALILGEMKMPIDRGFTRRCRFCCLSRPCPWHRAGHWTKRHAL